MRFLKNAIVCNQFFTILMLALVFQRSNSAEDLKGTVTIDFRPQSSYLVKIIGKGIKEKDKQTILGIIIDKNIIVSFESKLNPDNSPSSVTIIAGEKSKPQIRRAVKITRHPCIPELNVSIFYLDKPLEFNKFVEPAWIPSNTDRITPESFNKPGVKKHILGLLKYIEIDGEKDFGKELGVELSPCGDDTSAKYLEICTNDTYPSHFIPSSVLTIEGPKEVNVPPYPYVAGFFLYSEGEERPDNKGLRRFLDLTKLTCWMSGDPISCEEDPNIGTKACGKNLNEEWWMNRIDATEDPTDADKSTTDDGDESTTNDGDESTNGDKSTTGDGHESTTEKKNTEHLKKTTPDPNASNHLNKLDFYRIGLLTLILSICIFS